MKVIKRDGSSEDLNLDKIHKMVELACEGLVDVSPSYVETNSKLQFFDGITTEYIQNVLVTSANKLISLETPNYQYVAARLLLFGLYKSLSPKWQTEGLPSIYDHLNKFSTRYDSILLEKYTKREWDILDGAVEHIKDFKFTYASLQQLMDKYLIQDRSTGQVFETPQIAYMLIAATVFSDYPTDTRLEHVIDYYHAISDHLINLPTPIMAGVRSKLKSFASCSLLDVDDTTLSIGTSNHAVGILTASSSGIGLNVGRMRSIDSSIRDGNVIHPGVIPFLKMFESTAKAFKQANRGGSVTCFFPIWHLQIESIIQLKNNRGTEDTRVRHMDYCIQMSELFYKRFIDNENITLFSTSDVPGLYEAFGTDKFDDLYRYYESQDINKKVVNMQKLFMDLVEERSSTARIYIMNIDHANSHSGYSEQIYMSNLCVAPETLILTKYGYFPIIELENQYVEIWNGYEWSEVLVKKTGENQKLLKVKTNSGLELNCTPYHKWYVMDGYHKIKEVRTLDLKSGDKLIKCNYPIIDGESTLEYAYENGFYSGDGCLTPSGKRVYLYHEKRKLKSFLDMSIFKNWTIQDNYNREYGSSDLLRFKFFVPLDNFSVNSKIIWLAGLCDSDGTVSNNGETQSIQICSTNQDFLIKVQLMLHTVGVISKVTKNQDSGYRSMPANDGTGENKLFWCESTYRLLIGQTGIVTLRELGFVTHRLDISNHCPDRECTQYIKIDTITEYNGLSDTYCFTEPKRGLGVFNGILTGQCLEICQPSRPLTDINDTGIKEYSVAVQKGRIYEFVKLTRNNEFLEPKP
jgi:ribonucleoside-diphosphate reductase alpha chain